MATREGRPPIKLDRAAVIHLYNSGLSSQQLAPLFGVSWATINRRLKKWGIPIRYSYPAWNKGLTVESDERVRLNSLKTSRMSGHKHSPEARAKMSISRKGQNTWSKGRKLPAEHIRKISEASKRHWQNPDYRNRVIRGMIKGNNKRPTNPENRIINIIENFKLPYKYTGDGSFMVEGYNPDFVNINGAKVVIEVFGDYWHRADSPSTNWKRTELGRIMAFNSVGFRCIVLWESFIDKNSDDTIARRIKSETRRVSHLHG